MARRQRTDIEKKKLMTMLLSRLPRGDAAAGRAKKSKKVFEKKNSYPHVGREKETAVTG
jgi:hypothetical protein